MIENETGIDFENGIVTVDGVSLGPGYSFADFLLTRLYDHQDENRFFWLKGNKPIGESRFGVGLAFRDGTLSTLELLCVDAEFTWETEEKRKDLHDRILRRYGINEEAQFRWGSVSSEFDRKSCISSIVFAYRLVTR